MRRVVAVVAFLAAAACSGDQSSPTTSPTSQVGPASVSELAPMPVPRTEVAGAAVDGRIVVAGGLTKDGSASDLAHIYDPAADAWTEAPRVAAALHHIGIAAARGRVWVAGGFTNGPAGWVASERVWSVAVGESSWREEPRLPCPRGALAMAATADGTLVAFGGLSDDGVLASTVVLRPGAAEWEAGPDLAEAREHLAGTAMGDRVYAIGGRVGSLESNKRSVESWDPAGEGAWRGEPPVRDTRGGTAAAGRCVAGGEEPQGTIASVECLARDGREWTVIADLRSPRHGLAVVALNGRLHVIGGGDEPGLFVSGTHEVVAPVPA